MTIYLDPKRSDEKRRQRHDWSGFLGGEDTIASQTTTSSDVNVTDDDVDDDEKSVVFTLEGGEDGTIATIVQSIVTAAGDEETEVFVLPIGFEEPVSLREAKQQARMIEDDSQDEFINSLIAQARAYCERVSGWIFVRRQFTDTFSRWGDYLELWRRPVFVDDDNTITVSHTDETGTEVEYEGFLSPLRYPLRIYPGASSSFPALATGGSISVTYTAGFDATYGGEEKLIAKRAMLLLIGHWFENRETVAIGQTSFEIDFAVKALLDDLRPVSAY